MRRWEWGWSGLGMRMGVVWEWEWSDLGMRMEWSGNEDGSGLKQGWDWGSDRPVIPWNTLNTSSLLTSTVKRYCKWDKETIIMSKELLEAGAWGHPEPPLTREKNFSTLFLNSSTPNCFMMFVYEPLNNCRGGECKPLHQEHKHNSGWSAAMNSSRLTLNIQ